VPQHGLVVALAGGLPRLGYFADRLVLLRLSLSFLLHGGPQPGEHLGKNLSVLTTSTVRARSRLEASCCYFGEINDVVPIFTLPCQRHSKPDGGRKFWAGDNL
jgi:hypothetical protein